MRTFIHKDELGEGQEGKGKGIPLLANSGRFLDKLRIAAPKCRCSTAQRLYVVVDSPFAGGPVVRRTSKGFLLCALKGLAAMLISEQDAAHNVRSALASTLDWVQLCGFRVRELLKVEFRMVDLRKQVPAACMFCRVCKGMEVVLSAVKCPWRAVDGGLFIWLLVMTWSSLSCNQRPASSRPYHTCLWRTFCSADAMQREMISHPAGTTCCSSAVAFPKFAAPNSVRATCAGGCQTSQNGKRTTPNNRRPSCCPSLLRGGEQVGETFWQNHVHDHTSLCNWRVSFRLYNQGILAAGSCDPSSYGISSP